MSNKKMTVGDPITSRCTKCRKSTNHIIIAITDDVPAKVECNTCKGQHKYRPPSLRNKVAVRNTVSSKIEAQREWEKQRINIKDKQVIVYSMKAAFKVGSIMKHPVFGLGIVQSLLGPRKIEVLFEDGKRKMRCL